MRYTREQIEERLTDEWLDEWEIRRKEHYSELKTSPVPFFWGGIIGTIAGSIIFGFAPLTFFLSIGTITGVSMLISLYNNLTIRNIIADDKFRVIEKNMLRLENIERREKRLEKLERKRERNKRFVEDPKNREKIIEGAISFVREINPQEKVEHSTSELSTGIGN